MAGPVQIYFMLRASARLAPFCDVKSTPYYPCDFDLQCNRGHFFQNQTELVMR